MSYLATSRAAILLPKWDALSKSDAASLVAPVVTALPFVIWAKNGGFGKPCAIGTLFAVPDGDPNPCRIDVARWKGDR